jgi:hypothetical protein
MNDRNLIIQFGNTHLFTVDLYNTYHGYVFNIIKSSFVVQSSNPYGAYEINIRTIRDWEISISHKHIRSERNSNKSI